MPKFRVKNGSKPTVRLERPREWELWRVYKLGIDVKPRAFSYPRRTYFIGLDADHHDEAEWFPTLKPDIDVFYPHSTLSFDGLFPSAYPPDDWIFNDPMDEADFDDTHAFPQLKPDIGILGPPSYTRKQRGWYQVVHRYTSPVPSRAFQDSYGTGADIPTELFDMIAQHIPMDKHIYSVFSLVSRRWAKSLRPRLFEFTNFRSIKDTLTMIAFSQEPTSHISDLLARSTVSLDASFADCPWIHEHKRLCSSELAIDKLYTPELHMTGPLTKGLRTVHSIHASLPRSHPEFSPALELLELADVHFANFNHLVSLLREIPSLREVLGRHLTWDVPATVPQMAIPRRLWSKTPKLRLASFTSCKQDVSACWLSMVPLLHDHNIDLHEASQMVLLLHIIQRCKLDLNRVMSYSPTQQPGGNNFLQWRVLIQHEHEMLPIAISAILQPSGLSALPIQRIYRCTEVVVSYPKPMLWRGMPWERLDETASTLPHLECLRLRFGGRVHGPFDIDDIEREELRARLTRLSLSRKLVIEYWHHDSTHKDRGRYVDYQ